MRLVFDPLTSNILSSSCIFAYLLYYLGNHCPVGVTDGRILDSDITASTSYLNRPSTYGAHLGRLDNQPASGNIGAWRSVDGTEI